VVAGGNEPPGRFRRERRLPLLFTWLRHHVKQAVLGGIADAVAEIDAGADAGTADAVASLRQRLQALPAPPAGHAGAEPAEPNGSGRRKRQTA
jgi:hypothetical protein